MLKDRIDNFATDCGWNSSVKNVLIKGLQAIGIGAAIGAAAAVAAEAGLVAGLTAGAGIFIAGEATAKATDLSAEAAVTYAISQADTEEEAQSYADLVISMVEWGVIGLSAVGAYKGVKGKAPALRSTFSKAKISELFGLSRAKKAATIEKNIGAGSGSESFTTKSSGRQKEIKTSLFLRKGENPSKRPTWRQSEIDDTIRYRKAGYAVEPQVSFLDRQRCKNGTPGHEFGSMRRAVTESKDPNVEVIYMDKSLKDVTNGEINSRKRPDVTVVRKDGRIITHEVKSKSQTKTELRDKIDKMQKSLPENRRDLEGVSDVFDVEGRKI